MHICVCLSSEEQAMNRALKSMNDILIQAFRLYHKPTNPDKSRPCLTHRRLQLILSDWYFLNVVDSKTIRTKQTLV